MGRKFTWIGGVVGFIGLGVAFYYSVVTGWALRYFTYSLTGEFSTGTDTKMVWENFVSDPFQTVLFHCQAGSPERQGARGPGPSRSLSCP